jgi:hypothetical protein
MAGFQVLMSGWFWAPADIKVTERRTRRDYAQCVRELVDIHYPQAKLIRLVQDNLNTHDGASLYEAFSPGEARRILDKIEFHYTPKHGSWLNMAETEINIMNSQCLNRRLDSQPLIAAEVAAWEKRRNIAKARIHWTFRSRTRYCPGHLAIGRLHGRRYRPGPGSGNGSRRFAVAR